ncbi:MAG TPA: hypothetical protein VK155_08030 [Bacteroidales bacterium]|jgi:hypothetical protein|nr:hypothetical protein [Bacteroidales bacterium]
MRVVDLLQQGYTAEIRLKEAFIKTAEYHKTKPEIYYECQAFASLSDEHARYFRKALKRYEKSFDMESRNDNFLELIPEHGTGHNLADDLHYIRLLNHESDFYLSLLLQASTAINDLDLENACKFFTEENSKQSHWLVERISREVSQLLPIAG